MAKIEMELAENRDEDGGFTSMILNILPLILLFFQVCVCVCVLQQFSGILIFEVRVNRLKWCFV